VGTAAKITLRPEGSWWFLSFSDGTHAQFCARAAAQEVALRMQAIDPYLVIEVLAVDGRLEGRITPEQHGALVRANGMDHELGRQLDKVVASYNGSLNGAARSRKMS
jgi:hypothetical protein